MTKSESIGNLATALCAFQKEIEGAKKTSKNPFYNSKYADLAEVWETIREPLTRNGLSVMQGGDGSMDIVDTREVNAKSGVVLEEKRMIIRVETTVLHTSGEWISYSLPVPLVKTEPQDIGKAYTYARRYALTAALGIHQEDDDGNSHVKTPPEPKADTLKPARDKAYTELKKYAPTDQEVLALDKATDQPSLDGIVLSAKTRFERNQKPETIEYVRECIIKNWDLLKYNFFTKGNSLKKNIDFDGFKEDKDLDKIDDIALLKGYREHLREAVIDKKKAGK
jgi:hypothetical protein